MITAIIHVKNKCNRYALSLSTWKFIFRQIKRVHSIISGILDGFEISQILTDLPPEVFPVLHAWGEAFLVGFFACW